MLHTIANFFNSGGSFMWVIMVVLAASIAVMIERILFYYVICRKSSVQMSADVLKALSKGDADAAKKAVDCGNAPANVLLFTAVARYGAKMPYSEIEEGVQEAAITELPRMTQRLNYLSLFANIATLLGLIGTISGLQASFSSLAAVEASKKSVMLAAGIAEAMNCTAFGLMTAVPSMMMYTFLFNKQQKLSKEIDEAIVRMLNFFKKKPA
jgi:biopolymer transport protein ExbB